MTSPELTPRAELPSIGRFGDGQAQSPLDPTATRVGHFSDGQTPSPSNRIGGFSDGQGRLDDADDRHVGRFSDG